jgi:hypothetical protein
MKRKIRLSCCKRKVFYKSSQVTECLTDGLGNNILDLNGDCITS